MIISGQCRKHDQVPVLVEVEGGLRLDRPKTQLGAEVEGVLLVANDVLRAQAKVPHAECTYLSRICGV